MSDNTQIQQPSVVGDTISTEDIGGGIKLPRSKIVLGAHDVDGGDITYHNPLPVLITEGNADAFSRLRVSTPTSVFDSQFTYDLQPLLFEQVTSGTGATINFDSTNRTALMAFSSTPTGGKSFMQSFECFRYQPGRSQLMFITFNMIGGVSNVLKFVGYSDGVNGIEFQLNGSTLQLVNYSGTSNGNITVAQSSWSVDKLDGTGVSGYTLDITKTQILVIDLQALYVGRVRVGFDINGDIVFAHEFNNANINTTPYIQSANLPIRCGMTCTGTVSTTMNFICCSVLSEGGDLSNSGYGFTFSNSITAGSGTATLMMNLRPKTTYNSITNRSKFVLESINTLVTGSNPVLWQLCLGQAITGTTTYNDINTSYSCMQYNTAGTLSGSPSIVLYSAYTDSSSALNITSMSNRYPITLDSTGAVRALGTLTLLATGIGGTSACQATLNWREIR